MLKINKIRPLRTNMVVTGDRYEEDMYDDHGIIEASKGDLKQYQTVLEVGPMVRDIKPGDKVMINFMHFAVMQYDKNSLKEDMGMQKIKEFRFNWINLYEDDNTFKECLFIDQQDVTYAFEGKEVQGVKNLIITPGKKIILGN